MKIAMFCSNPVNGGTARMFYELLVSMRAAVGDKYQIDACVNENNPVEIYNRIPDLKRLAVYSEQEVCHRLIGAKGFRRIIDFVLRRIKYLPYKRKNIAVMKRYLSENNINCVIIHNGGYIGDDLCNQMLTAAYRCAEHTLCRTYVLHNDMEKNIRSKLRFWGYDKKLSREATEIVTVSNYTRDRILRSSFLTKDIKVIYNGICVTKRMTKDEARKKVNVDPGKKNILMIGNFTNNKGQYHFLKAAHILHSADKSYRFTIIGNIYEEEYYDECIQLINELQMENFVQIYHGLHDASEYIGLFDILAVPSMYDESFGLISVEAMANSVPVVAFACGGIPEVVEEGETGFLVPVGDDEKLAEKIAWLEEEPDIRRNMGEKAYAVYKQKFSPEAMTAQYLSLLENENQ